MEAFDDELFEEEDEEKFSSFYNSKSIKIKKLKEIRFERLNKQQQQQINKVRKNKRNSTLIWTTKKGLLKCNGTFELKRNRVGRPRRLNYSNSCTSNYITTNNNSQPVVLSSTNSINKTSTLAATNNKQEQNLLRCGLEWSVRRTTSSPINIPGLSIAHQSYSNESNQDGLLDISYNSDQFKVGSIRPNGILEQCMAKEYQNNNNPHPHHNQKNHHHHSYDFISSYSTSSSGVPASIGSSGASVFSINSSLASSSSTTSSSPSSPSLLSNFSTPDQDIDWLYSSGNLDKQQTEDDDDYLNHIKSCNAELCNNSIGNKTTLFTTHDLSNNKKTSLLLKTATTKHLTKDQQENALPFVRTGRQTINLVSSSNQQTSNSYSNSFKSSQKSAGYYASLHRGIIQPPNLQFVYSDQNNSLQSNNHHHHHHQTSINTKSSKNQANRRSRNGSGNGGKCRKKYGMENKQFWCKSCVWKKVNISI